MGRVGKNDFNISRIVDGNKDAFDLLFSEYYNKLCNYAWSIVRDWYVSEDIVQELFAEIWVDKKKLKIKISFSAYLYRSVYNSCLDYLKHQKVKDQHETAIADSDFSSFDDYVVFDELQEKIETSISQLPEQCRRIFKLSRFEDMKYRQIAEMLKISENSVDTQIRRALNKLRDDLKEYLITILIIFSFFF